MSLSNKMYYSTYLYRPLLAPLPVINNIMSDRIATGNLAIFDIPGSMRVALNVICSLQTFMDITTSDYIVHLYGKFYVNTPVYDQQTAGITNSQYKNIHKVRPHPTILLLPSSQIRSLENQASFKY